MTTILKAAQELERRDATGKQPAAAWVDPGYGTRWRWIGIVLLALVCSVGGFVLRNSRDLSSTPTPAPEPPQIALRSAPAPQVAPREPSTPPRVAERSLAETAQGNAPRETAPRVIEEEEPWARVEKPLPAVPPMARGPTLAATRAPRAEPVEHRESEPPPRAGNDPEAPDAEPQVSSRTGEPRVQLKSIAYSTNVAERIVTLRIDGGPAVRLRQGDSAGGLEVHLIHPRGVYLRHGGTVFAVDIAR